MTRYLFERGTYPSALELVDEKDLPSDEVARDYAREIGATYFWTDEPDGLPHGHLINHKEK